MVLRTGEVLERGPERLGGDHPEVDLDPGLVADRAFRVAFQHHLPDPRQRGEGVHRADRVPRCGEDVDVSDRFPAPSEAPGDLDLIERRRRRDGVLDPPGDRPRSPQRETPGPRRGSLLDRVTEVLDLLGPEPGDSAETTGVDRLEERGRALDLELVEETRGGLRPDPRDPHQLEDPRRDLPLQPFVILDPTGIEELFDLRPNRLPDAGDLRQPTAATHRPEVLADPNDGARGPPVRFGFEPFVLQVEEVGDPEQDCRHLLVGRHGRRAGARVAGKSPRERRPPGGGYVRRPPQGDRTSSPTSAARAIPGSAGRVRAGFRDPSTRPRHRRLRGRPRAGTRAAGQRDRHPPTPRGASRSARGSRSRPCRPSVRLPSGR